MSFADEMKKIGENIASSYDIRVSSVGDIIKDTHSTLKNFHTEHKHMSEEQRTELGHFVNELRKTTKSMLNEFDKEHKERTDELRMDLAKVPKMLHEFMNNFLKAANQFHNMLSSYYKDEIQKPVQNMLGSYHKQMNQIANEFHQGHEAWMSISRSMSAKKGRKTVAMERMNKAEQICSILKECPQGATPGMIAEKMGCTAQSLKTTLQSLKNQGRINKKQNKFFPK